jgi:hypothetical protein
MKRSGIIAIFVVAVIIGAFATLSATGVIEFDTRFSTLDSQGQYISVPTYGYLKCEEGDAGVRSPPIGQWQKFDSLTITCASVGTLVDECVVTFKMPSRDEVDGLVSVLGYNVCTIGGTCNTALGDDWTNQVFAKRVTGRDYNAEVNVPITKNQYIYAEYQESGFIDVFVGEDVVNKGRYAVSYTPYFIYRYDVFSQSNGAQVFNTEDCTNGNNIEEANLIIESVSGGGDLEGDLRESELLNANNLRARGARLTYLSNFVPVAPQYDLFEEDGYTKYCYDKKIYRVEQVETAGGTYLVANTGTNAQLENVECCNNGDVPAGNKCVDFEIVPLSSGEDSCSALKPCPIIGYQPIAGRQVAFQECVGGTCQTQYEQVACTFDEECSGGYCNTNPNDPTQNECVTREPIDYCGNGVCELSRLETFDTCAEDCAPPPEPGDNLLLYIVIGVLGGIVVIVLASMALKRPPASPKISL